MIEQLVEQIRARFSELEEQMSDPAVIGDREVAGDCVALRLRDGRRLAAVRLERLIREVSRQVSERSADLGLAG